MWTSDVHSSHAPSYSRAFMPKSDNPMIRLARSQKCPVCGKLGWCMITRLGDKALCMRSSDGGKSYTFKKGGMIGQTGYVFRLNADKPEVKQAAKESRKEHVNPDGRMTVDQVTEYYWRCLEDRDNHIGRIQGFADKLDLPIELLIKLGVIYDRTKTFGFPMHDGMGGICGIRYRTMDGKKYSLKGQAGEGIFMPLEGIAADIHRLFIMEGPTSLAVMVGLGFKAIGRPNCLGGYEQIDSFLRRHNVKEIYVCGDNDPKKVRPDGTVYYPGQDGMRNLKNYLAERRASVYAYVPPWKDFRDWWKRKMPRATDVMDSVMRFREA